MNVTKLITYLTPMSISSHSPLKKKKKKKKKREGKKEMEKKKKKKEKEAIHELNIVC
jgi:hypothetical protein